MTEEETTLKGDILDKMVFDDSDPPMAALNDVRRDGYATDQQRRAAAAGMLEIIMLRNFAAYADSIRNARRAKKQKYYDALAKCAERYKVMAKGVDGPLEEFIDEFIDGIEIRLPLYKLNRWLGYIQGQLILLGATSVDQERDWTRPLFRPLDFHSEK